MPLSPSIGITYGEELARIYRDAELAILRRIAELIARGIDAPDWEVAALARAQDVRAAAIAELNKVNAAAAAAMVDSLNDAYAQGGASALRDIGKHIDPVAAATTAKRAAVGQVADALTDAVNDALPQILRAVDDVFREVVGRAVADATAGGIGRQAAAQGALDDLLGKGLNAIEVGRGVMSLPNYVSMAVRTGTAKAAIQGHLDTMQANGLGLVVIHPGPRACDICDAWASKVLSIDGTIPEGLNAFPSFTGGEDIEVEVDGTLDDARDDGWGHPNCRCGIGPFIPGVTSKDILDRPPWDAEAYQAQQEQRTMERTIREWKDRAAIAITPDAQTVADAKVAEWQERIRDFLKEHPDLKRQPGREQIGRVL